MMFCYFCRFDFKSIKCEPEKIEQINSLSTKVISWVTIPDFNKNVKYNLVDTNIETRHRISIQLDVYTLKIKNAIKKAFNHIIIVMDLKYSNYFKFEENKNQGAHRCMPWE